MIRRLIAGFFMGCTISVFGQSFEPQKTFPKEEIYEDFRVLYHSLIDLHPGLYRFQDSADFHRRAREVWFNAALPDSQLTERDVYMLATAVMSPIGCGHTAVRLSKADYKYQMHDAKFLPYDFYIDQKRRVWVHYNNHPDDTLSPGTRILSINDISVETLIDSMGLHVETEGMSDVQRMNWIESAFQKYLYYLGVQPDRFEMECIAAGQKFRHSVAAMNLKDIEDYHKKYNLPEFEQAPLRLDLLNDSIAVLTIERFILEKRDDPDYVLFLAEAFKTIKKQEIEHLVINLRGNEGGKEENAILLWSYLINRPTSYYTKVTTSGKKAPYPEYTNQSQINKILPKLVKKVGDEFHVRYHKGLKKVKPHRHHFNGKVYFLQDRYCFSASSSFLSVAKKHRRGLFIGSETAGVASGNNGGMFIVLTLPNTGLQVTIPIMRVYINREGVDKGKGVQPDFEVYPTVDDVIHDRNPELERALELIR